MTKNILKSLLLAVVIFTAPSMVKDVNATTNTSTKNPTKNVEKKAAVTRTIWGASISPYVRKVLVTMYEKNLPFEHKEILPISLLEATKAEVPVDFAKASPFGKIPAFLEKSSEGTEFYLQDSDVIMNYLDAVETKIPLRPKCAKANAKVSKTIKYGDDELSRSTHRLLVELVVKPNILKTQTDDALVKTILEIDLPASLDFLEKTLKDGRKWIADTKNISLADITIVCHLISLIDIGKNIEEMIGKRTNLLKYVQKVLERESFKKVMKK